MTRQRIRELRPNGISWKAKNMMPFAALEELPDTGKIMVLVDRSSQKDFLQTASGKWEKLGEGGRWTVWERNRTRKGTAAVTGQSLFSVS